MNIQRYLFKQTQLHSRRFFATASSTSNQTKLIKDLRAMTGSPIKDCIKVLDETKGDLEKAKELLRQRGLADAEKKIGRATAEGFIAMKIDKEKQFLTMVELHCETDFVAKTSNFRDGLERFIDTIHQERSIEINHKELANQDKIQSLFNLKLVKPLDQDLKEQTIGEGVKYIISKTQENCRLAKVYQRSWKPDQGEFMQAYIHNPQYENNNILMGRVGSFTLMKTEDKRWNQELQVLGQQMAWQIAAMKPVYVNKQEVPAELKQKLLDEGPHDKALWKMYHQEVLMEQEVATSEEAMKVKDLIRQREGEIGVPIRITEWGLFLIGIIKVNIKSRNGEQACWQGYILLTEMLGQLPQLKILNSFSQEKEVFVPQHKEKNSITWYMCGPTVYDVSHMGHARTYVSSDIIKRILRDFFGYDVKLCMNITDIDDKIIRKANEVSEEFSFISRKYEADYFEDMKALNVEYPDVITRVSEFVPEIIDYIKKIIENGYAYEANGSVYFDVSKYNDGVKHKYAKLEPTSSQDQEKLMEGEGVLTEGAPVSEKRNPFDFSLWKKSKPGEPLWESPWGQGRPGWHIECSAMASDFFKECPIDIHSGGIDLRFPHHDNEIAQSEAYYDCDQWIRYFIHTGHLHIHGRKMAKSLKNFITIKNILSDYNARQIRFLFLLHNWESLMNYSTDKSMPEAVEKERQFSEFFKNVKAILRQVNINETEQKWSPKEYELYNLLSLKQTAVYESLADNFDTPSAVNHLAELVTATNAYLQQDKNLIKAPLVRKVSKYLFKILKIFGVYDDDVVPQVFEGQQVNQEELITPYINAISKFRDQLKEKANEGPSSILQLCDQLRDDVLPGLGIRLEDRGKGVESIWKYEDKEVLIRERDQKVQEKAKKEEEKRLKKELELKKKSTSGSEWFKVFFADKYSQFDEEGLPTHDAAKKPLKDEIRNKLRKEQNKQKEVHQKWLDEQKASGASKEEEVKNQ